MPHIFVNHSTLDDVLATRLSNELKQATAGSVGGGVYVQRGQRAGCAVDVVLVCGEQMKEF